MAFKNREVAQKYYQKNKRRIIQRAMRYNEQLAVKLMQYVYEYLRAHPCVDCGETDPCVLEFDHVRGEKRTEVMRLARDAYGWNAVKVEIAKCDVRCANCHRKRHAKENAWYYRFKTGIVTAKPVGI